MVKKLLHINCTIYSSYQRFITDILMLGSFDLDSWLSDYPSPITITLDSDELK